MLQRRASSTTGSWRSTASGSRRSSPTRPRPRSSSRTTGTCASGRCFHDEYLPAFNRAERHPRRLPGRDRRDHRARRRSSTGSEYEVDCIVYATGFEAELTPLPRRAGHEIVGRGGVTSPRSGPTAPPRLFGMMTPGFPNMFVMPAPASRRWSPSTTRSSPMLGAEFVAATIAALERRRRRGVRRERRGRGRLGPADHRPRPWPAAPPLREACRAPRGHGCSSTTTATWCCSIRTPGSYGGGGFGDYFGFRDLLAEWREQAATSPDSSSNARPTCTAGDRHAEDACARCRGSSRRGRHAGAGAARCTA